MLIVYQNQDNTICILSPAPGILNKYSIEMLALKDVPEGFPFWIVNETEIPIDRTFREAWEIPNEWDVPDGYGSEFNSFEEVINAQNQQ